ncbi:MAG: alpha/beta hydrolase [Bacilli bacterium]|nr:alpha/beta hydrolase [Bacilli bacterium]
MIKKIKDLDINYIQYGKGPDIVLLHGWGQNIKMMDPLGKNLSDNFTITILDLPGFGSSEIPKFAYTINDYTEVLHEFLESLKIEKPILIGHSFGGRIAINYASIYEVSKLVLFGSPFIVREKKGLKVKLLKTLKEIKFLSKFAETMKNYMGSEDYKAASGVMREILVKTVNTDLRDAAANIKVSTLLIWGENDTAVPVSEAKELEKTIKDSALIVLQGTHYCYLENLGHVVSILEHFL